MVRLLVWLVVGLLCGSALAQERRLALVIGNAAYRSGPLKNPVNDARDMAQALADLGFQVIRRENTNLAETIEAMREFSVRAPASDVRFLFYAGHGLQHAGKNYLVPIEAELHTEEDIPRKTASVTELLDRLALVRHGINIIVLDACRDHPFMSGVIVGPDGRRVVTRSLGRVTGLAGLNAPSGTFVAFSTAPGSVARDIGGGRNSLYTKHLLAHVASPGMPIERVFKAVRLGVAQDTRNQQIPWENTSLMGEFCFRPGASGGCP